MDYFTLLDLPVSIPVDKTHLNAHYQALQRHFHPDNFAHATPAEQREAIQKSAMINDAYRQLKHPLRSVEYFLSLHGEDVTTEATLHDTEFLMSQLELREQLDDISYLPIADQTLELETFSQHVASGALRYQQQLAEHLQNKAWHEAGEIVIKLQFFEKLQQQIEDIKDKFD